MKKPSVFFSVLILSGFLLIGQLSFAQSPKPFIEVTGTRVEYQVNPVGVDVLQPRFSWKIKANVRNIKQIAYEIRVGQHPDKLKNGDPLLWTSKKVQTDESNQIVYQGPALKPGQKYYWTVRIWDNQNHITDWSATAFWETGLLNASNWKAYWIESVITDTLKEAVSPLIRKTFKLKKEVKSARLYITAHGLYQLEVNGKKPNDWVLTPGWTSYHKHLQYQTYDVTGDLQKGENAIGIILGKGWYSGYLAWNNGKNLYGKQSAVLAQLEVEYADGSKTRIVTDKTWKFNLGPILMSEIYHGETYDARLEIPGWSTPSFSDKSWKPVAVKDYNKDILVAQVGPPVRDLVELTPVNVFKAPNADTLVDMGQNMVGWVRLKVNGKAGSK
ncbi:MAG: family 78 glycoside hydrolase catalytic domain, partial [Bacteroidales bacterium]|nr:family 78 glycoside hydrolase catalytic domain [Bacteroidales bacterium]